MRRFVIAVLICALITLLERAAPFLFFKGKPPQIIEYLGRVLPLAIMTTLLIYCVRTVEFASIVGFLPTLSGILITGISYWLTKNSLIGISVGTITYMVLLRVIV